MQQNTYKSYRQNVTKPYYVQLKKIELNVEIKFVNVLMNILNVEKMSVLSN